MRQPTIRIGTTVLTPSMQKRLLAGRTDRDIRLALLALRAAGPPGMLTAAGPPRRWADRLMAMPFGYAGIMVALAEGSASEATESRSLTPGRYRDRLRYLARRARTAALEARDLAPPPPPPRVRLYALFPEA